MIWKDKRLRLALWMLGLLLFVAVARDMLANGRPLYCRLDGATYFPGLRTVWRDANIPYAEPVLEALRTSENGWKTAPYESAVFAPIPFSPSEFTRSAASTRLRPGTIHPGYTRRFRHWLGTDANGRDVAAMLVAGARVAVVTGGTAMALAFVIGLFLGALAGFFGDDRLRLPGTTLVLALLAAPLAGYYAAVAPWGPEVSAGYRLGIFLAIEGLALGLGWLAGRLWPGFGRSIALPADLLIMRLAELFNSVPRLIVVVAVIALLPPQQRTIGLMIALIGALSWTSVAKYIRAELLRVRALDFVTAARGLGFSESRILLRHALPNALRPALIVLAFGVGQAIVLEAALAYLGIGPSRVNATSWGALLESARITPQDWWVVLPPGLAIGLTVLALHLLGDALSDRGRKSGL